VKYAEYATVIGEGFQGLFALDRDAFLCDKSSSARVQRRSAMGNHSTGGDSDLVIATIENSTNPEQSVGIRYLRERNSFATSGIRTYFGEKEILVPAHLAVSDFQLMGTILSTILEGLSRAKETEGSFQYVPEFEVLDRTYTLTESGEFMKLEVRADPGHCVRDGREGEGPF
jgi:hypothetical protein